MIGECFETQLRAAAPWSTANKNCGAVGRRVPTIAELDSARQNGLSVGVQPNNYEGSSSLVLAGTSVDEVYFSIDAAGNRLRDPVGDARPYGCVTTPTN